MKEKKEKFLIKEDISLNKLSFNDGEVIDAKYVTVDEFSRMIENNEAFEWLRYFLGIMKGKN